MSVFFLKCDFSKEHCSSLKMILGSKHVGAILKSVRVLKKKSDFSKEQCSCLKMILGSKHVGAILKSVRVLKKM